MVDKNSYIDFAANLDKAEVTHTTPMRVCIELSIKIKELEARIQELETKIITLQSTKKL